MAEPLEQNPSLPAAPSPAGAFPAELKATSEPAYSALSITAMIGFGIAALYAGSIGLMAVVGLFARKPLLLTFWTALVPLSAILLCLLARARIRSSEGTLAGESLVRWGLLLSLFVTLSYWAYFAAVYFAVRQQARGYVETWMDQIRDDDMARAALAVLPPLKRLGLREDDPNLLAEVEQRLAALEGPGRPVSMFNTFYQVPLVRLLVQNGREMKIIPRGVTTWDYVRGGYEVVFLYDLETPEGTFEATITTRGLTAPQTEYERRQWYIEMKQTRLNEQDAVLGLTDKGRATSRLVGSANGFLQQWLEEMAKPAREGAFLLSLPQGQREKARADLKNAAPLIAVAGPVGATLALPSGRTVEEFTRFLDGGLIRTDGWRIKGAEEDRREIVAHVRKLFAKRDFSGQLQPSRSMPLRLRVGDHLRFRHDIQIGEPGRYFAEGFLEIECDAKLLDSPEAQLDSRTWRFVALHLLNGKKAPSPRRNDQ